MVACIFTPVDVDLQRRLLDSCRASCELDEDTLQQLADVTGDKWASVAPILSFTTAEIEEIRDKDSPAQAMLHKLKAKGIVTHEQLCSRLQTISLLKSTIWVSSSQHSKGSFFCCCCYYCYYCCFSFLFTAVFVLCFGHSSVLFGLHVDWKLQTWIDCCSNVVCKLGKGVLAFCCLQGSAQFMAFSEEELWYMNNFAVTYRQSHALYWTPQFEVCYKHD